MRVPPLLKNASFLVKRLRSCEWLLRFARRQRRPGNDLGFKPLDRRLIEGLGFEQRRCRAVEQSTVLLQDAKGRLKGAVDELADRPVHRLRGLFAIVSL